MEMVAMVKRDQGERKMGRTQAHQLASERVRSLRSVPFQALQQYIRPAHERVNVSGSEYVVETQAFWDDQRKEALRVLVSVWQGDRLHGKAVSQDFILDRSGRFVGEDL